MKVKQPDYAFCFCVCIKAWLKSLQKNSPAHHNDMGEMKQFLEMIRCGIGGISSSAVQIQLNKAWVSVGRPKGTECADRSWEMRSETDTHQTCQQVASSLMMSCWLWNVAVTGPVTWTTNQALVDPLERLLLPGLFHSKERKSPLRINH